VERLDLRRDALPEAATVVANLMRPLLLTIAQRLPRGPARLILSGLLDAEADEVAAAFSPLDERRRVSIEGWSSLLLER